MKELLKEYKKFQEEGLITHKDMSDMLGINESTLNRWVAGKTTVFTSDAKNRLSSNLDKIRMSKLKGDKEYLTLEKRINRISRTLKDILKDYKGD